ncbi:MAG: excinuclease ABC subunit UvrA, partial [Firmicutes bacterium]|nr:excinuclease ABC subunit UvrA [Bacillota bacterium]
MAMEENIIIKGARENNLKNVNLTIPRNKLVVFTGVSGSGKSTMAFDTIFAEGQRRYIESLSSYARMFLGQSQKPDCDTIEGLSPSISIDQKTTNHNPRSTVGTITEIYDYFRLLFSRVGTPYCPNCNKPIQRQSIDQIVDKVMSYEEGRKILILAPVVRAQKGAWQKLFDSLRRSGYGRVIIDGNQYTLDEEITLDKNLRHDINVVVDRLVIHEDIVSRLTESLETALKLAEGLTIVEKLPLNDGEESEEETFSINFACPDCGYTLEEITPRIFSFNNPYGACEECSGLGYTMDIDESLVLKNAHLSINQGALNVTGWSIDTGAIASLYLKKLAALYDIDMNKPLNELPREQLDILLYGTKDKIEIDLKNSKFEGKVNRTFEGLINNLKRRYKETTSEFIKFEIGKLMREQTCKKCHGKRLNIKALSVKIDGKDIDQMCQMSAEDLLEYINNLKFEDKEKSEIAESILKEIKARLGFLVDVGLNYLTLSRSAETLSGGESQRIRLATQIGSGLVGVLYILDEPSIGLHQRDNEKLLGTIKRL